MANVSVRKERSPERGVLRRGEWFPGSGFSGPWDLLSPWSDSAKKWTASFAKAREGAEGVMWSPNIDIRERDNQLVVSADLPGLNKEDVKIEVTDEGLSIRGERKRELEERREGYYRSERSYGTFYRLVPLPDGANVDQAKANFRDGVLEVTVPIPEGARKRREIPIEATPKARTSGGGA